jgi:hypothetical protein
MHYIQRKKYSGFIHLHEGLREDLKPTICSSINPFKEYVMSNISSVSGYVPATPAVKSNFETNNQAFGAVASGSQGAGDVAVDAPSAVVNISDEGFQKLGDSVNAGGGSVELASSNAGQGTGDAVDSVDSSSVSLYQEVSQMAQSGWSSVKSAAHDTAAYVGLVDDNASASSSASTTSLA